MTNLGMKSNKATSLGQKKLDVPVLGQKRVTGWRTNFEGVRERGSQVMAAAAALEAAQPELLPITAPIAAAGLVASKLPDFNSRGQFFM